MNKHSIEKYEKLEKMYYLATAVCDPIEYTVRQKNLLYAIADFLLDPYYLAIKQDKNEYE